MFAEKDIKTVERRKTMLFYLLSIVRAMADECTAVPDGVVLNKYYLDTCTACKNLEPVIEKVQDKLREANVKVVYREIECTECACENIKSFPTLVLTRDKKKIGETTGYRPFEDQDGKEGLGNWVAAHLSLEPFFVDDGKTSKKNVVKELVTRDFLSGFNGQWLILFYEDASDQNRKHFKALAESHGGRLNIGEIRSSEARNVTNRFNITEYPHVVGINHGNAVPYAGEKSLSGLRKFADRLHEPNFESITYSALSKMGAKLSSGEPIYVVLYKNYELASHYFNDLAQQFKFRARIYKSSDPAMFEAAGFHPKDYEDFAVEKKSKGAKDHSDSDVAEFDDKNVDYNDVDHNQMLKLLVYKNHTFYPSHVPLDRGNDIVQWIFHTHFSHVTNINNENFYTVFHGIKPVMILLTSNEQFLEEFNKLSADKHLGTPYTTILFATLDVGEYPLFKKQVLPLLKTPALAFYDPLRVRWFITDKPLGKMGSAEFSREATQMIDSYIANKLPSYPPKKSRMSYYMVGAWVVLIAAFFCFRSVAERYKTD